MCPYHACQSQAAIGLKAVLYLGRAMTCVSLAAQVLVCCQVAHLNPMMCCGIGHPLTWWSRHFGGTGQARHYEYLRMYIYAHLLPSGHAAVRCRCVVLYQWMYTLLSKGLFFSTTYVKLD
jgi:hypothetical protein